jgi:hypothetical protein
VDFLRIVGLGVLAAVSYGIVHDQVTARVCVEYFTIGHPPLIDSTSPTLLGLAWGVAATWWVGLPLGLVLATAARLGRPPKLAAAQVRPLILRLLAVMAVCALVAGLAGYVLARRGDIALVGGWAAMIPQDAHSRFLADAWAHNASYLSGIVGGLVVAVLAYRRRARLAIHPNPC